MLGIIVVFLVLAAQFESWINPFVIMLTVPLAMAGGLLGLYITGNTLNLYSQIGLVMLIGMAAKNGILIVEFTNQMRAPAMSFYQAVLYAAEVRLRPIVMTAITTAAGALPLIFSSGAGAETRMVIGVVVLAGILSATFFTLFVVPVAYSLLARRAGLPGSIARRLQGGIGRLSRKPKTDQLPPMGGNWGLTPVPRLLRRKQLAALQGRTCLTAQLSSLDAAFSPRSPHHHYRNC